MRIGLDTRPILPDSQRGLPRVDREVAGKLKRPVRIQAILAFPHGAPLPSPSYPLAEDIVQPCHQQNKALPTGSPGWASSTHADGSCPGRRLHASEGRIHRSQRRCHSANETYEPGRGKA